MDRTGYGFTLAIDFDGTICEHKFPAIGEPKRSVKRVMKALHDAGCKIIIYSCRCNPSLPDFPKYQDEMEAWLKEQELPYDEIWKGIGKPIAHVYIDDRGIPFTGWADALNMVINLAKMPDKLKEDENAIQPVQEKDGKERNTTA
ncbi:MAG: hypothetical protein WC208_08400 [Gallionella sp.]|jgi:hypothetical protein